MTLIETYIESAKALRRRWEQVTEGTGKRGRGPVFIAVTICEECHGPGLTSSKAPQRSRFTCKTCRGPAIVAWADGKVPTEDEQYEMWAKVPGTKTRRGARGHWKDEAKDGKDHPCQREGGCPEGRSLSGNWVKAKETRLELIGQGRHLCEVCGDADELAHPDETYTGKGTWKK
jgi:hypothetical protein